MLGISKENSVWVAGQWKTNMATFSRIAVGQSLNVNQLVDMEWRFGGNLINIVFHGHCEFNLVN